MGVQLLSFLLEIDLDHPFFVEMLTPRISYETVERQYMRREPRRWNIEKQ